MALSKIFPIKESLRELKKLQRKCKPIIYKRLQVLILFKRYESTGISKLQASKETGFDQNSIQNWRSLYINGGIKALMSHKNTGYKPSLINAEQELELKNILHNPENGFVGYIELQDWFNKKYSMDIAYDTFRNFIVRKFKSNIKVARKYHLKKDQEAVEAFKKTLIESAKKSSKKKKIHMKK